MPLSTSIMRGITKPHRIVFQSAAIGFVFFLLFVICALTATWNRNSENNEKLAVYMQGIVASQFNQLQHSLQPLQAVISTKNCDSIRGDLIQQAAFSPAIRAIILINDGMIFCSSATGNQSRPLDTTFPSIDINKPIDVRVTASTRMVQNKPSIILWLANRDRPSSGILATLNVNLSPYLLLAASHPEISGLAIAAGESVLTTWDEQALKRNDLPPNPLRTLTIPGYPITLYLFGEVLPIRDIQLVLLGGLLLSLIISFIFFIAFNIRQHPGKAILDGIKRGEFHIEYQPVINAKTGDMYGMEALLRWTHPTEGRIPPNSFIGYAEQQNLIIPLTRHLFSLIAKDAETLRHTIPAETRLGINISPLHLSYPTFREDVLDWLAAMPANHFSYVFEITERAMVDEREADEIFRWIRQQKIQIAIDDFGTGHSALIYLEKFEFDYLKIDRGFVLSIGTETVNSPVLDVVLALAKKLNLNTVAEGVETEEQARWLVNGGVTYMQGYLYSPPRPVNQLIDYFLNHSSKRASDLNAILRDD